MKRFIFPILWGTFVSLLLYPFFVFQQNTHAEGQLKRKVSKDILQKVSEGKGGEFVRVIIQPASQQDLTIDSTIEYSGGSNLRKSKDFAVRVATLPASAAVTLANRSDVAYVSLSR